MLLQLFRFRVPCLFCIRLCTAKMERWSKNMQTLGWNEATLGCPAIAGQHKPVNNMRQLQGSKPEKKNDLDVWRIEKSWSQHTWRPCHHYHPLPRFGILLVVDIIKRHLDTFGRNQAPQVASSWGWVHFYHPGWAHSDSGYRVCVCVQKWVREERKDERKRWRKRERKEQWKEQWKNVFSLEFSCSHGLQHSLDKKTVVHLALLKWHV